MPRKTNALHDAHVRKWCFELRRFFEADHHAHVKARHDESLHEAHVRAKTPWALSAQDAASRAEAQANAWRDKVENIPSNANDMTQRTRDYKRAIERSTVIEDYEFTSEAVDSIDFALNEYQAGREGDNIKALRKAKKRARDDLSKAHRALSAALSAFAGIETNPYAVSALHAVSRPDFQQATDGDIEHFAHLVASLRQLAEITARAQEQGFSDGLPTFPEGAQPNPGFEALIFRLSRVFDRVDAYTEDGKPEGMNQSTRAGCIVEILAIADIRTRSGQPYGKKAIENWLARAGETLPKIKDLDTPAN